MSRYQFDAYGAYEDLRARYPEFLLDTLGVRAPPLAPMLRRLWSGEQQDGARLFAPLLVQGAFPYHPGLDLGALTGATRTSEKPLHPRTVSLLQQAGIDYQLFQHQVEAIRSASEGKTVVVAAGTGSGKTEAFLIPIIDRLIRDEEEGRDDLTQPGVRALVVYPLNALVNNQVDRLLGLLGHQREITFAYYTSRLKEDHAAAKRYYAGRGRPVPPPCQIVDRNTLRGLDGGGDRPKGPPHILVTNFSMLEYMLIRPKDRTVFLEQHLRFQGEPRLKMIVLDEAHVYVGAQAAEMHMLLRRAADRFGTSLEELQGFATSATLSRSGTDPSTALSEYASRMFAKPVSRVAVVEGRTFLPEAKLQPRSAAPALASPDQLPADPIVPVAVRTVEFDARGKPVGLVVDPGGAQTLGEAALTLGIASTADLVALAPQDRERPALVAYRLCSSHPALLALRGWLFEREQAPTLDEVSSRLYGEAGTPAARRRAADAVLRLAALGRMQPDALPFIPVRMHAFVRAPLGVWVDPRPATDRLEASWPWGKLHVTPTAGEETPRFPMLVCSTCGATYLEAEQQGDGTFAPAPERGGTHALFARDGAEHRMPQQLGSAAFKAVVIQDRARFGNRIVAACAHCLAPNAKLRSLRLSARLALSAMIDTVFPHLGEMPAETAALPAGGRRLMTFSDSRQEAARVAAQVEQSHDVGVNRAMLWRAIERQGGNVLVKDLIADLENDPLSRQRAVAEHLRDAEGKEDLARFSVFEEFGRPPAAARNTLETLGLVEVVYPNLPPRPDGLESMTEPEWHAFVATVLDLVRSTGCVHQPKFDSEAAEEIGLDELVPYLGKSLVLAAKSAAEIDEEEEAAEEGQKEPTVALIAREGKGGSGEYLTDEAPRNRFTRYAIAVGERVGISWEVMLAAAFKALQTRLHAGCKWLRSGAAEDSLQVVLNGLELRTHGSPPLTAGASGALHFRAVQGAVPGLVGSLSARPLTEAEQKEWRFRHAVKRVLDDQVLGMWTIEHTAQIDVDSLEDLEGAFRGGHRNLLASSTTMEMGVDIGGLTLVVLTNVPPGPANYWQRAGRAGRRADGTSMTLTLALPTAHDQLVFGDARRFLYSAITPPRIRLDAEPLLVRHVNAFLLAQFFQAAVETRHLGNPMKAFGTVEEFVFEAAADGVRPEVASELDLAPQDPLWVAFRRWLESLQAESSLAYRVRVLCRGTVLAADSLSQLAARAADALAEAVEDVQRDAEIIAQQRHEEEDRGAGVRDEAYLRALDHQRRALVRETLIGYFAGKGFLPRFGFPLDVVRLNTKWRLPTREDAKLDEVTPDLRLERSLDIALAEYVPGDEIIAGKRVFRSAGIERNWFTKQNALDRHFYFECVNCRHLEDGHAHHAKCPVCGHDTIPEQQFLQWKEEEQKQRAREARARRAGRETAEVLDGAVLPPSVVRSYLRPSGFAVKLGRKPRRVVGDIDRVGPALSRLSLEADANKTVLANGAVAVAYCPGSRLFVRAEGKLDGRATAGYGFAVCRVCGFSEAETGWSAKKLPPGFLSHHALRGFKKCPGTESGTFWRHAVLGTTMPVDAVRLELTAELAPKLAGPALVEPFYRTLAAILQLVAARRLQVDLRALSSGTATRALGDGSFTFDAVVYETATSGLLADVVSQPASLLADLRTLLESGDEADFIRFDTQFLGAQLRPDLVRAHFADPERRKLLDVKVDVGERILRGASPVTWGIEFLQDPAQDLLLIAPRLAPSAFDVHGLIPHVRHRAADPAAGGNPVRLLLADAPALGGNEAEAVVAARLRQLAEIGVQIRRGPMLGAALVSSRWHMAARKGERYAALGGVWLAGATQKPELRFGPQWFAEGTPVEADSTTAKATWDTLNAWWADAKEVTAKDFERPNAEGPQVVLVPPNLAGKANCVPSALLNRHFQPEGGLAGLGRVTRLVYCDRYVGYSALSLYYLRDLLNAFAFAPDARAFVRSQGGDPKGRAFDPSKLFVVDFIPPAIDHATSSAACEAICRTLAERVWVEFKILSDLPHPRKLMVQFAPGGRLKSLVVRFDHGLAWARFSTRKTQKWPEALAVSRETHAVIWRDKPLAGESGWL